MAIICGGMSLSDELKTCFLCAELNEQELSDLTQICISKRLVSGELLFLQGDSVHGFFLLISGRVRIYKSSPDGKEYTLHQVQPGQMFAEAAMFKGEGYPANCAALADSKIVLLPQEAFFQLLRKSPEISLKMMGALSSYLRDFNQMIEDLSLKEVPARLASFLLTEREKTGQSVVKLTTSKSELAHSLGTISETLSRNFRKFREIGAIKVEGSKITLLNCDRLREIADGEKL
ncbi:MAG: Crp/Fnr family transcriptional regulator [candidate division Zixibacteria bacterium]